VSTLLSLPLHLDSMEIKEAVLPPLLSPPVRSVTEEAMDWPPKFIEVAPLESKELLLLPETLHTFYLNIVELVLGKIKHLFH